jgi:hypothetical protein
LESIHLQPILQSTDTMPTVKTKKRRKKGRWLLLIGVVVTALLIWAAFSTSRLGYESAAYEVERSEGQFELRQYTALTTVATPMGETRQSSNMDRGFGRLFKYITGNNVTGEKVAMTTPVLIDQSEGESAMMNFVLPRSVADAGAPEPAGDTVELREFSSGKIATIRFHGYRAPEAIAKAEVELRRWIEANGWTAQDDAMQAFYDPPWTPGFLRRNEVLIRIDS